jgi:glutathione synthase
MKPKFAFLWITDPWETLDHPNDTTLRLTQESMSLGHENYWCDASGILLKESRVWVVAKPIVTTSEKRDKDAFVFADTLIVELNWFDCIQYRLDPPIDANYLQPLQLLVLGMNQLSYSGYPVHTEIVNIPESVLMSDKIEALLIPSGMPATVVTSDRKMMEEFTNAHRKLLIKPMNFCQSKGVHVFDLECPLETENLYEIAAQVTDNFTRPAVLQELLPAVTQGEFRLWYLDGELIGWAKKLPVHHPYIFNIDKGDPILPADLEERQVAFARSIGERLWSKRIRLAAIDIVGDKITDYNFACAGLLVQVEAVMGENLAGRIIQRFVDHPIPYLTDSCIQNDSL